MATMVLPFDAMQDSVTFVSSGVRVAERLHSIRRFVRKSCLTMAYRDLNNDQVELIAMLEDVQHWEANELILISGKMETLVEKTDLLISRAREVDFWLWHGFLDSMEKHNEKLDSLAESFRMSASASATSYVGNLVESAAAECASASGGSWRDFVATLHD